MAALFHALFPRARSSQEPGLPVPSEPRQTRSRTYAKRPQSASPASPHPLPPSLPVLLATSSDCPDLVFLDTRAPAPHTREPHFRILSDADQLPRPRTGHLDADMSDDAFIRRHRPRQVREKRCARLEHEHLLHERVRLRNTVDRLRSSANQPLALAHLLSAPSGAYGYKQSAQLEDLRKAALVEAQEMLARYDYLLLKRQQAANSSPPAKEFSQPQQPSPPDNDSLSSLSRLSSPPSSASSSYPKKITLKIPPQLSLPETSSTSSITAITKPPRPRSTGRTITDTFFPTLQDPVRRSLFPPEHPHSSIQTRKPSSRIREKWAWGVQAPQIALSRMADFDLFDYNDDNEPQSTVSIKDLISARSQKVS